MSRILTVRSIDPPYRYDAKEAAQLMDDFWLRHLDSRIRKLALKFIENSQVEQRFSAVPAAMIFSDLSFEERNRIYIESSITLAEKALKEALESAQLRPEEIDVLITTSCTGFMIPSVDAHLVNRLAMKKSVVRLPVTEMGCAGGTAAMIYAHRFSLGDPCLNIAIVSVEIPTITFQRGDLSAENLVSSAIFADGAAAMIIGPGSPAPSDASLPSIIDTDMHHFEDSTHLMGFDLRNSGLKIVLDREIPDVILKQFDEFFVPFLDRNGVDPRSIGRFLFHPGGKKIVESLEQRLASYEKDLSLSKQILRERGNMSSATILHVIELASRQPSKRGERDYVLAFGPGFSAQSLLLQWN